MAQFCSSAWFGWQRRVDGSTPDLIHHPQNCRQAFSDALPFPLNWIVPYSQRREMRRQLAGADGAAAYADAADAIASLADRLRASKGRFFFGDKPSSLDALAFGHLAFYLHSPVAAPVLRSKVRAADAAS